MNNDIKTSARYCMNLAVRKYRDAVFYTKWVVCIAITCLVWGGAIWFGSLAWDQKQGAVLALMGFGAWLAVCRLVLPFNILIIGSCKLNSMVTLTVELSEELANALAQLVKRVGFSDMRSNAVDDVEAYLIRDAIDRVRMGLANADFSPR